MLKEARHRLLGKSKLRKYLAYAIGEIILVVIGILIALSINNWNEDRKQAKTEKEFIKGVRNDLIRDRDYMKMVVNRAKNKDQSYIVINEELFTYYNSDRPRLDSLLEDYFLFQRTFYPIYGSFQSAVSGNQITQFRNKAFTNSVTKLYNSTYARLMDNGVDVDNRWHYLTKKYSKIRRTGHMPDMTEAELNEFLDDMYYHMFGLNYYTNNLETAIREIDNLLEM